MLSVLFSNTGTNTNNNIQYTTSHIPTYINISPRRDGITAKVKYLNNTNKPLKRKLRSTSLPNIFLPKLRRNSNNSISNSTDHNSKNPLLNLPLEIISKILHNLDYKSIQKFSKTCSKVYMLCQDNSLWRGFLLADFSVKSNQESKLLYKNYLKLNENWTKGKVQNTKFLLGHQESVYCLDWVDNNTIISGSKDKSVRLWNLKTGECNRVINTEHQGSILCIKVNKQKTMFVTGSSDATCILWDLHQFTPIHQFRGHVHSILDCCFINDMVITASRDHSIRIWDVNNKKEIKQLLGHHGSINSIEVLDDNRIASASGDSNVKIWDIHTGLCLKTFEGNQLGLATIRSNGQYLFTGGLNGKIKIWDIETGNCLNTLVGHIAMIRSIDIIEGKIISGSYDRTLKVWDVQTGACLLSFQNNQSNWIYKVLVSKTRIISSGQDNRIMTIDFGSHLKPLLH